MNHYNEFVKKNASFKEAVSWVNNKKNIDSQSRTPYSLHNISFTADYCGQASAGANNYHKSPTNFNTYMSKVIKEESEMLFNKALELMKKDVEEALINADEEITKIKNTIDSLKIMQV